MSSRKILLTLIIAILVSMCLIGLNAQARQEGQLSIKQLVLDIQNTQDINLKRNLLKKLNSVKPQTIEDVQELMNAARSAKYEDEKEAALEALNNIKEEDKHLGGIFLKSVDDSDREIRIMAIKNLRRLKDERALPKMRKMLKDYNVIKFKALNVVDKGKSKEMMIEGYEVAMALAEMKDEEGLAILIDKMEGLEGAGSKALAHYGKKGLTRVLELARDEKMKDYGMAALVALDDKEAEDDLIEVVKDDKEPYVVRLNSMYALTKNIKSDKVINEIEKAIEKSDFQKFEDVAISGCYNSKTDKAVKILIEILKYKTADSDKEIPRKEQIISYLGEIGNPMAIPVLEEALKDRNRNIRELTIHALITIADRDSLIRLREYLNSNLGNVVSLKYDKASIKLIDKRLKSGKRGTISFEEMER